jgi:hypothetical protein
MSSHRIATLLGALVCLAISGLALYRLLVGIPITIGTMKVGQVSSFLVFVICAGLALMLFRGSGRVSS